MPLIQKNITENEIPDIREDFRSWITLEDKDEIARKVGVTKKYVEIVLRFDKHNDVIFNLALECVIRNKSSHEQRLNEYNMLKKVG